MTHINITGSRGTKQLEGDHGPQQALEMPPTEEVRQIFGTAYTLVSDETRAVRLHAEGKCNVAFAKAGAAAPVAVASNFPMVTDQTETVFLAPGDQIVAAART